MDDDAGYAQKLGAQEVREGLNAALPRPPIGGFERNPRADAAVREVLAEKMSPEALQRYDGIVFLNTTGDLPFPDPEAFYTWVEEGHAVIGMHAAADTLHGDPRYARMLGGEFASVVRFKDMPVEGMTIPAGDEGKLMHIGLPVGDDMLMATDTLPALGQETVQGNNFYISIHPDSREDADRIFAALSEGGTVEMPMADQVWGDYYGALRDRFGTQWMVNYGPQQQG